MSLMQQERQSDESEMKDMPSFDYPVRAWVEVTYSDQRRKEMRQSREKNCSILISLFADKLRKKGADNVEVMVPADKDRFADFVFQIETDSAKVNWEALKKSLVDLGGQNIGDVRIFVIQEK